MILVGLVEKMRSRLIDTCREGVGVSNSSDALNNLYQDGVLLLSGPFTATQKLLILVVPTEQVC